VLRGHTVFRLHLPSSSEQEGKQAEKKGQKARPGNAFSRKKTSGLRESTRSAPYPFSGRDRIRFLRRGAELGLGRRFQVTIEAQNKALRSKLAGADSAPGEVWKLNVDREDEKAKRSLGTATAHPLPLSWASQQAASAWRGRGFNGRTNETERKDRVGSGAGGEKARLVRNRCSSFCFPLLHGVQTKTEGTGKKPRPARQGGGGTLAERGKKGRFSTNHPAHVKKLCYAEGQAKPSADFSRGKDGYNVERHGAWRETLPRAVSIALALSREEGKKSNKSNHRLKAAAPRSGGRWNNPLLSDSSSVMERAATKGKLAKFW